MPRQRASGASQWQMGRIWYPRRQYRGNGHQKHSIQVTLGHSARQRGVWTRILRSDRLAWPSRHTQGICYGGMKYHHQVHGHCLDTITVRGTILYWFGRSVRCQTWPWPASAVAQIASQRSNASRGAWTERISSLTCTYVGCCALFDARCCPASVR